jgi:hypothetical protein
MGMMGGMVMNEDRKRVRRRRYRMPELRRREKLAEVVEATVIRATASKK